MEISAAYTFKPQLGWGCICGPPNDSACVWLVSRLGCLNHHQEVTAGVNGGEAPEAHRCSLPRSSPADLQGEGEVRIRAAAAGGEGVHHSATLLTAAAATAAATTAATAATATV